MGLEHLTVDTYKSDTEAGASFVGTPRKATITFNTPFPNNNYNVQVLGELTSNRTWTIESKLAGSFVINSNSNSLVVDPVEWLAIKTNNP